MKISRHLQAILYILILINPAEATSGVRNFQLSDLQNPYQKENCWFELQQDIEVSCGFMTVPENHSKEQSARNISFPVVQLGPFSHEHMAIILGGGGPGGSVYIENSQSIRYWEMFRKKILGNHGLIIIDQRGAGKSLPSLACSNLEKATTISLRKNLSEAEDLSQYIRILRKCHQSLSENGNDLSAYNTAASVSDVENLRVAMDVKKWDLIGFSYGTRLGFEYIKKYPFSVRSAVMDSVLPPLEYISLADQGYIAHTKNFHETFQKIQSMCQKDRYCANLSAQRNMSQNLETILEQLMITPITFVAFSSLETREKISIVINDHRFISMLALSMYDENLIAAMPKFLRDISEKQNSPYIDHYVEPWLEFRFSVDFADALYHTISCHESFNERQSNSNPINKSSHNEFNPWYSQAAFDSISTICQNIFKKSNQNNDQKISQEPKYQMPILMLSGLLDPATPVKLADVMSKNFPNMQHYKFWTSHIVSMQMPCSMEIIRQFLHEPNKTPLDSCTSNNHPLTFL